VRSFVEAGFSDVALVQIGGDRQDSFFGAAEKELLPPWPRLSPSALKNTLGNFSTSALMK